MKNHTMVASEKREVRELSQPTNLPNLAGIVVRECRELAERKSRNTMVSMLCVQLSIMAGSNEKVTDPFRSKILPQNQSRK